MRTGSAGIAIIRHYEGFSATPYTCPGGHPTIGYGHLILPSEGFLYITPEKADELLVNDVKTAERAVGRLIAAPLTQNRFDALVSFTYNLGSGALQSSTLRRVINRQEYSAAPYQFRRWVYAGGRKLVGLMRRRESEAQLFSTRT